MLQEPDRVAVDVLKEDRHDASGEERDRAAALADRCRSSGQGPAHFGVGDARRRRGESSQAPRQDEAQEVELGRLHEAQELGQSTEAPRIGHDLPKQKAAESSRLPHFGTRVGHELAESNAGGADRFARPADEARIEVLDQIRRRLGAPFKQGPHQIDPASRVLAFDARNQIGRARLGAEPAMDAIERLGVSEARGRIGEIRPALRRCDVGVHGPHDTVSSDFGPSAR